MLKLETVTTEYIDIEDRVRLTATTVNNVSVQLWLTPRLLQRLLPNLFDWLKKHHSSAFKQKRQTPKMLKQATQPQVQAIQRTTKQTGAESLSWLVTSIDISYNASAIQLTFKGHEAAAVLSMDVRLLQQWLNILLVAYRNAEWPLTVWPPQFIGVKIKESSHSGWYHISTPANA